MSATLSSDDATKTSTKASSKNSINVVVADALRTTPTCPYLDTVNRPLLDFDNERSCSVTMRDGSHVYGCLVCGRFFLGRGERTPARVHSVDTGHAVFVHLSEGTFHCLPDDYEIVDRSLTDVSAALRPEFTAEEIRTLDDRRDLARDLFGRRYLPGFVGLNNPHRNDCVNAVVQALVHVRPLRDWFLASPAIERDSDEVVVRRFGELTRRMWSDKRFRSNVDPHTMTQAVAAASDKRFDVNRQCEAGDLVAWLLHRLHLGTTVRRTESNDNNGRKRRRRGAKTSIVHETFQGRVEVTTRQRRRRKPEDIANNDDNNSNKDAGTGVVVDDDYVTEETTVSTPFLQLTLDIPEKPLFKDDNGGLVIPQEPLENVLRKFDGETFHEVADGSTRVTRRRYRIVELPEYLVIHLKRFKKNEFGTAEKNPTIVAFPVANLDLGKYVKEKTNKKKNKKKGGSTTEEELKKMSTKQLIKFLAKHDRRKNSSVAPEVEKDALFRRCVDLLASTPDDAGDNNDDRNRHRYDLVANITHDSPHTVGEEQGTRRDPLEEGTYRCHVRHEATRQWYEMRNLHVTETMPQLIALSESYVLIFRRRRTEQERNSRGRNREEEERRKRQKVEVENGDDAGDMEIE